MVETTLSTTEQGTMHEMYRYLHRHPELSMQEHRTAEWIEARLDEFGLEHFRCGGTGVVAMQRNGDGPVVAFRADIDGLPIQEDTGAEYTSEATGVLADGTTVPVMHGCGHDTHITSAMMSIALFERQRDSWAGTVVWIFQPGEEVAAGANAMVADGLWDRAPKPEVVLGQHVYPTSPTGTVAIAAGNAMASADALKVTVFGKQAHGSQPQDSIDPIVLAAHMVTSLQTIASREVSPQEPVVVTCATFHAGMKENIIPDRAEFTLNIRALSAGAREKVLAAIERILNGEADASGAPHPTIEEMYRFPLLVNDIDHGAAVRAALQGELGAENVIDMPPVMGSEDFGALAQAIDVPSVYWNFGAFPADMENTPSNHSPFFLPAPEPTLTTGVRAVVSTLRHYVGK